MEPDHPSPSSSFSSLHTTASDTRKSALHPRLLERSDSTHSQTQSAVSPTSRKKSPQAKVLRTVSVAGSSSSRLNVVTDGLATDALILASNLSLNVPVLPGLSQPKIIKSDALPQFCQFPNVIDPFKVTNGTLGDHLSADAVGTDGDVSMLRRALSLPSESLNKDVAPLPLNHFGPDDSDLWRHTLEDLPELSENEDSLQSRSSRRLLLARAARTIPKDTTPANVDTLYDELESVSSDFDAATRRKYMKNLIVLGLSFLMIFASYLSLRNLQSSLNDIKGLGTYALCSVYAALFVGSFLSKFIVERLCPKRSMVCACFALNLYALSNFYPSFYTIIPAALITGFWIAIIWTAQATYVTNSASGYSESSRKQMPDILSYFNGIFYALFHLGSIVGNTTSSLILQNRDHVPQQGFYTVQINNSNSNSFENSTLSTLDIHNGTSIFSDYPHCGANYDLAHSTPSAQSISDNTRYMLVGIFFSFSLIGSVTLAVFLDPLEGIIAKSTASLWKQISAVFKFFVDVKVVLLIPLMAYSLLQATFLFGEFTKSFVTCTAGVHLVGYSMVCAAAAACVASYIAGTLVQFTGRAALLIGGISIHQTLLMTMWFWVPTPEYVFVLFIISGIWGFADGIILNQVVSLIGTVFEKNRIAAFAALKVVQSMASFLMFLTSPYMLTSWKIHQLQILGIIVLLGYGIMEIKEYKQNQKKTVVVEIPTTP